MRIIKPFGLLIFLFVISACGSAQDRRDSLYEKAKAAIAAGETKNAQIAIKNAIKIDPQFAKGYIILGNIQIIDRNFANAFASYSRATELDANELDAQMGLCKLFFMQRDMERVEEKADFVLTKAPDHVEAGVLKAIALTKKGRVEEALKRLSAIEQTNPNNIDVILAKSEAYMANKSMEESEATMKAGIEKLPENVLLRMHLADFYKSQNRIAEAEQQYRKIVALAPETPGYNILLANFLLQSGQSAKLHDFLESLVKRFPQDETYRLAQYNAAAQLSSIAATEEILLRAHKELPDSNQILLAMAEHYARTMQVGKAENVLKDFINKAPNSPQTVRARRLLAGAYLSNQQPEKAQNELTAIFERNPRDIEGHFLKGNLDLQRGNLRDAILELRQVVDDDPKSQRAFEMLIRAHLLNNEGYQAEALLQKSLKDNPNNLQSRMLLVQTLASLGKPDRALTELNVLTEKDASNPAVFITKGDLLTQKQKTNEAIGAYKRAIELAPKEAVAHIRLGYVLALQKDFRGAHEAFDKALALAPDSKDAATAKVGLYSTEKLPNDAIAFARKLLAAYPKDVYYSMLLGRVLMSTNDLAGAEQLFIQAQAMTPDSPAPYHFLGQVKIRQGKLKEGIAKFRDAFKADPDSAETGLALGTLLQTNNSPEEAQTVYEQVLAKHPNYMSAINNLAYLYAQDLPTSNNLKKAQTLIERLKNQQSPVALDTVGWVLFKVGKTDEALSYTLRALDKNKNLKSAVYHLGVIYQAKGDTAKAITWFEKAIADNTEFAEREAAQKELSKLKSSNAKVKL